MKCMRSIAETYHHEVMEAALPETLFGSLVELMRVTQRGEFGEGVRVCEVSTVFQRLNSMFVYCGTS